MADTPQTLATLNSALAQNFRDQVVRTINRRAVLLRLLRIVKGAGKNVAWDVELDGAIAEAFADGDAVANFGSDAVKEAIISWGALRSNFRVGDIAAAAAASSGSPQDLANLVGRNFMNSVRALTSLINKRLFSGTTDMVGMDTALRDDNTYAGVDRTQVANAPFRANVIDSAGAALTLSQIRKDITVTIYNACGDTPDIAVCSAELFEVIGALFQEFRRHPVPAVTEVQTARGTVRLDGSLGAIEFEGCVFFKDKDATANTIYYLNSENVEVEWLPQVASSPLPDASVDASADDGRGVLPLGMKLKRLGPKGASSDLTLQAIAQLAVRNPKACGRRINIAA
jgi:hypothetical protein